MRLLGKNCPVLRNNSNYLKWLIFYFYFSLVMRQLFSNNCKIVIIIEILLIMKRYLLNMINYIWRTQFCSWSLTKKKTTINAAFLYETYIKSTTTRFDFDLHFSNQLNGHFFLYFAHFQFIASIRSLTRCQCSCLKFHFIV